MLDYCSWVEAGQAAANRVSWGCKISLSTLHTGNRNDDNSDDDDDDDNDNDR